MKLSPFILDDFVWKEHLGPLLDEPDLRACLFVSRRAYRTVIKLIYVRVTLFTEVEVQLFARTMHANGHLASMVEYVSFSDTLDEDGHAIKPKGGKSDLSEIVVASFLPKLQNLWTFGWESTQHAVGRKALLALKKCNAVYLDAVGTEKTTSFGGKLSFDDMLALPSLRQIILINAFIDNTTHGIGPDAIVALREAKIARLLIVCSTVSTKFGASFDTAMLLPLTVTLSQLALIRARISSRMLAGLISSASAHLCMIYLSALVDPESTSIVAWLHGTQHVEAFPRLQKLELHHFVDEKGAISEVALHSIIERSPRLQKCAIVGVRYSTLPQRTLESIAGPLGERLTKLVVVNAFGSLAVGGWSDIARIVQHAGPNLKRAELVDWSYGRQQSHTPAGVKELVSAFAGHQNLRGLEDLVWGICDLEHEHLVDLVSGCPQLETFELYVDPFNTRRNNLLKDLALAFGGHIRLRELCVRLQLSRDHNSLGTALTFASWTELLAPSEASCTWLRILARSIPSLQGFTVKFPLLATERDAGSTGFTTSDYARSVAHSVIRRDGLISFQTEKHEECEPSYAQEFAQKPSMSSGDPQVGCPVQ